METSPTSLDAAGMAFIQGFEGCVLHPYLDVGGTPTIGYGMTHYPDGVKVTMEDPTITQEQANAYFAELVVPYCKEVLAAVKVPLNQNQLNALTDFTYNCGDGAFDSSPLCATINSGAQVTLEDFTEYDHVGKVVDQDLLKRRTAEYNLFISSNNTNIKMEDTTAVATENVAPVDNITAEVEARPQVVTIKSVQVTYDRSENGQLMNSDVVVTVKVTPELVAALALFDSGLVEEGYNIQVVGA